MNYDTAGNIINKIIICSCCNQDTGGNHEWHCPNNPYYYSLHDGKIKKEDYWKGYYYQKYCLRFLEK